MKTLKRNAMILLIISLFTISLISCGNDKDTNEAKGFQWVISKESKEMYLVGTIHIADPTYNYMNKNITKFIDNSDGLAVEVDITSAETITGALEFSFLPLGETIEKYLTPEELEKFKSLCTYVNLPYDGAKLYKPATLLSYFQLHYLKEIGSSAEGVDSQLLYKFRDANKKIYQLETVESQFKLLDEFQDINELKKLLAEYDESKIDEYSSKAKEEAKDLVNAYINGDSDYMLKQVEKTKKENEAYYNKLVKERNINMSNEIDKLFKEDGTKLVAVGALHFFGEDSIIKLLEEKGYTVKVK
ncbi:MAG: TraB/GumN family protein [Clostridium sp.]